MKKISAIILIAIVAVGALGLAAFASGRPFMSWKNYSQDLGSRSQALEQSFVRVDGFITKWGIDDTYRGFLGAQSRNVVIDALTTRQGASATAVWSNETRPISGFRDKANFNYTFYAARLTAVANSSLNADGYSFVLNGTWNVFKVFSNFTTTTDSSGNIVGFSRNQDVTILATEEYGNLTIAGSKSNFTLAITGIAPLTGSVHVQRIATKMFNPFRIHDDTSTTVTKADVSAIVSCYGSSPGWGSYDQRMDYNFNYKVDIADLSTAAANIDS